MTNVSFRIVLFALVVSLAFSSLATGQVPGIPVQGPVRMDLGSPVYIDAVAGQIITVNASVSNTGSKVVRGIAYISIVDEQSKIPIDLEDWSAQKGIWLDMQPGQSVPTNWSVRLVKSGTYTVAILFSRESDGNVADSSPPVASSRTVLTVAPKINLNPENVLPVAFGVPLLLVMVLGTMHYLRGRTTGLYG